MALKSIISKECKDLPICSSCANYLSVFPIYLKSDSSGVICGRCTPFNKDSFIRDEAYEAVADFLVFPCCFDKNGCELELTPQGIQKHELECMFRKFECPSKANTNCDWLGNRDDIVKHFEDLHEHLFLKDGEYEFKVNTSCKEILLLSFDDELFVVKSDLNGRQYKFSWLVQHFAFKLNSASYNYSVRLFSHDKKFQVKLPQKSTRNVEKVTATRNYINNKLQMPQSVLVRITIFKFNRTKEEEEAPLKHPINVKKNPMVNWELIEELECPVCLDIMHPPIYQCNNGHSICCECKLIVKSCPLCKGDVVDTRNYSLEKLTRFLTYPCKYYKSGCQYAAVSAEIKKHEKDCESGPYSCPLKGIKKCQMQVAKSEILCHFEECHSSFILKSNKMRVPFKVDGNNELYYLMKFSSTDVFLVRYKYENRKFYWTVQLMGSPAECRRFKFEIDVTDNCQNNLKCYLKGFCVSIREKIDFTDPCKYLMLAYEQVQPLIKDSLHYTIDIVAE